MKIYTKTGDRGETSLFGGTRVSKANLQVEAYGVLDEFSSFLGLAIAGIKKSDQNKEFLIDTQRDIWQIMAVLSSSNNDLTFLERRIREFESKIDELTTGLPPLKKFILPGGNELSARFHMARTLCRRAERRSVALAYLKGKKIAQLDIIIRYLNRLSDLLFTYARYYGKNAEILTR